MSRIENTPYMSFENTTYHARLSCIVTAFLNQYNIHDVDKQYPYWLRAGVEYMRLGIMITPTKMDEFDQTGGTYEPDPFFRPNKMYFFKSH